jgi:hypothetical protein
LSAPVLEAGEGGTVRKPMIRKWRSNTKTSSILSRFVAAKLTAPTKLKP